MELGSVAVTAKRCHVNMFGGYTGGNELFAIRGRQIDMGAADLPEMFGDFRSHLETTRPDSGADGSIHRARTAGERSEGLNDNTSDCAAPSRMNSGNYPQLGVDQQNR